MTNWKNKLMAFLHDPPHKPYGIANHEKTVASNLRTFGLSADDFTKENWAAQDAVASAADRFCFPNPRKNWPRENGEPLRTTWKAEGCPFIHPFCGSILRPHCLPVSETVAEDWMSKALAGCAISEEQKMEDYVKAWRLWCDRLVEAHGEAGNYMPYLVADTRIPDHTIWQHNVLVSALASSGDNPAFLVFQIGPVQSFIAQARKTADLWAGSYLLSFLLAKGIAGIMREFGPDHFIFPQLRGNPLIDQLSWDIYGEYLGFTADAQKKWREKQLLIPCMPNRFLAVFSETDASKAAKLAAETIETTWREIAAACKTYLSNNFAQIAKYPDWDDLWEEQVHEFPRSEYWIEPFENTASVIDSFQNGKPPFDGDPGAHPVLLNYHWATDCIHHAGNEFYDPRNYKNRRKRSSVTGRWEAHMVKEDGQALEPNDIGLIDNPGFAWALDYMRTEWKFGAVRNARTFQQRASFGNFSTDASAKWRIEKDPLDGVNEVIGGRNYKQFWADLVADPVMGVRGKRLFVGAQRYGAISVIKRLFDIAYLSDKGAYGFEVHAANRVKSTHEIATGRPISCSEEEDEPIKENECGYYAVLCMDGDDMGKWLSGQNAQPLVSQISGESITRFFRDNWWSPDGLDISADDVPRALTPSYHAALSEALANFANYCVEPVVDAYGGQLIYAGGDDVLAMVPARDAVKCANDLQLVFRGVKPQDSNSTLWEIFDYEFSETQKQEHVPGFLKLKNPGSARPRYPLLVPGPRATASCGIAIGHCKSPMQDVIQTARKAEKWAKDSGKHGFALTVMKRSGETHSFFSHWSRVCEEMQYLPAGYEDRPDLAAVMEEIHTCLDYNILSGGFAYKYCQYIAPVLRGNGKTHWYPEFDDDSRAAVEEFLRIALERQGNQKREDARQNARRIIQHCRLESSTITPEAFMNFWMALAFLQRLPQRKNAKGGSEA